MPFPFRKMRARRDELGLTRPQLAELSEIPIRYVEALEQGRRLNPTQDTLEKLCLALKVNCEFFFGEDLPEADQPPARGRPATTAKPPEEEKPKRPRGRPKKGS